MAKYIIQYEDGFYERESGYPVVSVHEATVYETREQAEFQAKNLGHNPHVVEKMPRLVMRRPNTAFQRDIDRIVSICHRKGYNISEQDAELAWRAHSEIMTGTWLFLDGSDEDVFMNIEPHLMIVDN